MSEVRDRILGYGFILEQRLIEAYNKKKDEYTERPTIDITDYAIKRNTIYLSTNDGAASFFKAEPWFKDKKHIPKNETTK